MTGSSYERTADIYQKGVDCLSAEKNIDERIEQLNALYRNERQNTIMSELLDIVSGFEALRKEV